MPQRKPVQSLAKSESLQGNTRAVKEPAKKVKERDGFNVSLSAYRRERLRAAMIALNNSGWPSDKEVLEKARELAYGGIDAYVGRAERDNEEAMIV